MFMSITHLEYAQFKSAGTPDEWCVLPHACYPWQLRLHRCDFVTDVL